MRHKRGRRVGLLLATLMLLASLALWRWSYVSVIYLTLSLGQQSELTLWLFPGVLEVGTLTNDITPGVYEDAMRDLSHDPSGERSRFFRFQEGGRVFDNRWTVVGHRLFPVLGDDWIAIGCRNADSNRVPGWTHDDWYFINGEICPPSLYRGTLIGFPIYLVVALASAPLWVSVFRWRRRRLRLQRGLCVHCGYDLQRESGRKCPECGGQ